MKNLQNYFSKFIENHVDKSRPILIALSGGVDSLTLYELSKQIPHLKIGVAHVDHGWRAESLKESMILKEKVESDGFTFHSIKLEPSILKGNLENACREKRYEFFKWLCENFNYQAVLLGHHCNDKIETALKRILEGAFLEKIYGIKSVSYINGIKILRPLLSFYKKDLEEYINYLQIVPFHDSTNFDRKFLRSKMRLEILPFLNNIFGKNIVPSLISISEQAEELSDYLEEKFKNYPLHTSSWCSYMEIEEKHSFEIRFLVKKFLKENNLFFSKKSINSIVNHLINKSINIQIHEGKGSISLDRGKIFFFRKKLLPLEDIPLKIGSYKIENWNIAIEEVTTNFSEKRGWRAFCEGELDFFIDSIDYQFSTFSSKNSHIKESLLKIWSSDKIPVPLRSMAPFFYKNGHIKEEILCEKSHFKNSKIKSKYRIKLSIIA